MFLLVCKLVSHRVLFSGLAKFVHSDVIVPDEDRKGDGCTNLPIDGSSLYLYSIIF